MNPIDREALIEAGLDPDDAAEVAAQYRVREYLICYALWRRCWASGFAPRGSG